MTDETESRSWRRKMILMVMASAFLVWQVPAMDFFDRSATETLAIAKVVSTIGFLIWAAMLVTLLYTGRIAARASSAAVCAALEDELVRANRARSFAIGYLITLVTAATVFTISLFQPMTGVESAHLILVVAVVAPMYTFVVLESRNA